MISCVIFSLFLAAAFACSCAPPALSHCGTVYSDNGVGAKFVFQELDQQTNEQIRLLTVDNQNPSAPLLRGAMEGEACASFGRCRGCPAWVNEDAGVQSPDLGGGGGIISAGPNGNDPATRLGEELPTIKRVPNYWGSTFFFINEKNTSRTLIPKPGEPGYYPGNRCCGADPKYIDYTNRMTVSSTMEEIHLIHFGSWPPIRAVFNISAPLPQTRQVAVAHDGGSNEGEPGETSAAAGDNGGTSAAEQEGEENMDESVGSALTSSLAAVVLLMSMMVTV